MDGEYEVRRRECPRVLVFGDVMLDRYTFGVASRVSPESPVLVVKTVSREVRLGGAGNTASNCRALGAEVALVGIVGSDHDGITVRRITEEEGIQPSLVVDDERCTTVKERILGYSSNHSSQQLLRLDTESTAPAVKSAARVLEEIWRSLEAVDVILVSDYGKGVCTPAITSALFAAAGARNIPVLVDPARGADWSVYRGATLVKPNRSEAAAASGLLIQTHSDAERAAKKLSEKFGFPNIVVTLDQDGMVLLQSGRAAQVFEGVRREVSDVSGAGDTVFAVVGVSMALGHSFERALGAANVAAGIQVCRQGATAVTWDDIAKVESAIFPPAKIVARPELKSRCDSLRRNGRRIVFTNGCFDLLHVGHIKCLQEAAALGDVLVVAINSDRSVRRLKGAERPVNCEEHRAAVIAALSCVDIVTVFDEDTPRDLLALLRPEILAKGGDYSLDDIVGRDVVESYGGRVVVTGKVSGVSTSRILERISD